MTTPDAAAFAATASASDPRFFRDGRIVFLSSRGGPPHAFVLDSTGDQATDLTPGAGVVYRIAPRPAHHHLLYVTDVGGDEQHQIHILDLDSGRHKPLLAVDGVINGFGAWSKDGLQIAYASNARNHSHFDVFVLHVDTDESRCVLEDDGMNAAERFFPDGQRLLISRPNLDLPGDNDLFVVALGTEIEAPRCITAHEGAAEWQSIHAYSDGTVLALCDENREYIGVQRIDGRTGERSFLRTHQWDIELAAVSPSADRIALVVNKDGYSQVEVFALTPSGHLGDVETVPSIPPGVVTGLTWNADGSALALTFESASIPPGIRLLEIGGTDATWLPGSSFGVSAGQVPEPTTIRYRSFDGSEVPALFYRPDDVPPPWPCLVVVHGGPEAQSRPSLWRRYAGPLALLGRGVALLVPNVRGSTGYGRAYQHADDRDKRMDAVRDLLACTEWLAASGEVDTARIGVMGQSYGGFMTLAAITEAPERWAAAVDLYGIANFETLLERTGPWRRRHRAREYGEDPSLLRRISPIHKASSIRTPLLVAQGDRDVRVPQAESEQIVAAVRANDGVVEYVIYPDEGHGIEQLEHRIDLARRIDAFCSRHLRVP
jgi:dipeptidyl aminopeptidase/acylaminoacyl peptidase